MSFQFQITHHGEDKLGMREILQRYADDQWFAEHYTSKQAADALLDRFKRVIAAELELIEVEVLRIDLDREARS